MADQFMVVSGFHDGYELYKKVIPRPPTYGDLLQIINDFASQSVTMQGLLQQNPGSELILSKLQQRFKFGEIDAFVDLPSPEISCDEKFKPEYQAQFLVGVNT